MGVMKGLWSFIKFVIDGDEEDEYQKAEKEIVKEARLRPTDVKPFRDEWPDWANYLTFDRAHRKWIFCETKPVMKNKVYEYGVAWYWEVDGRIEIYDKQSEENMEWEEQMNCTEARYRL